MKRNLLAFCLTVLLLCTTSCMQSAPLSETEHTVQNLSLKRGINMSRLEDNPKQVSFMFSNRYLLNIKTYEDIKAQGFDHIRLPINFDTYYENGAVKASFLKNLDKIINAALDADLAVVLDFHGWQEINSDVASNKEEFYAIWEQVAEHYKDYSNRLLFELLNEPHEEDGPDPLTAERLNEIQPEVIRRIRKTNPTRILVAAVPEWNTWWGLEDLQLPSVEEDPQIIVDIHTYQPMEFTHQGTEIWTNPDAELTQVRLSQAVINEIDKVVSNCLFYEQQSGRRVWLGEFGMFLLLPEKEDVTVYYTYVTMQMEAAGIPWAYWEYDRGCGAYDRLTGKWKDFVLEGLIR